MTNKIHKLGSKVMPALIASSSFSIIFKTFIRILSDKISIILKKKIIFFHFLGWGYRFQSDKIAFKTFLIVAFLSKKNILKTRS